MLRAVAPLRRSVGEQLGLRWNVSVLLPENQLAFQRIARHRPVFVAELGRSALDPGGRLFLRLDRELAAGNLPVCFVDRDGRPPRVRHVSGPLMLEHSPWATPRDAPPVFPGSAHLDRAGLLRRRLVTVFASDAGSRVPTRIPVEATRLEHAGLEAYLALRPDQTRAEIEARWRAGHVGFVGRAYGRVIAASWLAPGGGSIEDLGCELRLEPETAAVYDDFVEPALRRRGVLDPVADLRSAHALREGWKRCVALVPPDVPGAWIRLRRNRRPVVAELQRLRWGRPALRLEPGVARSDLPFRVMAEGRGVAER